MMPHWLLWGAGDMNPGSRACTVSTGLTEPALQPRTHLLAFKIFCDRPLQKQLLPIRYKAYKHRGRRDFNINIEVSFLQIYTA
jgi:hypothetical protein